MSWIAVVLFAVIGLGVLAMFGLQVAMLRKAMALEGSDLPELPGKWAELARGSSLVFFHSPTCGPCRAMAPHVDRLAAEDRRVHSVDVSRDPKLAMALGVMATPTTLIVRDGKVEKVQLGAMPPGALQEMASTLG